MGLENAERVLLTGCSAGGLAAYLQANHVHAKISAAAPSLKKFKVAPASGFFLLHSTVENELVYPTQMQYIFSMAHSVGSLNANCLAAVPKTDQWKCMFAPIAYAYIDVPVFPIESSLDKWQTKCIFTS